MNQLGIGIYTLSDAARLIRANPTSIKRWLYGYVYIRRDAAGNKHQHCSKPLWLPEYGATDFDEKIIGFQDLMEIRIVREFVSRGVPLIIVRKCLDNARELFGADYPMNRQRFLTDGATVYHEAVKAGMQSGEAGLLDLGNKQFAFRTIVKDSLYAGIEYEDGQATRWYPDGKRGGHVVIDPARQFGHPIVKGAGIATSTLYATYLAEGKVKSLVARIFEVEPAQVDAAVRFEEKLRKAA